MINARNIAMAAGIAAALGLAGTATGLTIDETFEGQWGSTTPGTARGWNLDMLKLGPELRAAFITGFVYDDNGDAFWVTGTDNAVRPGENTLDFDLIVTGGGQFGPAAGDPGIIDGDFGTLSVEIEDCKNASASFDTSLGSFDEGWVQLESLESIAIGAGINECVYQEAFDGCPAFSTPVSGVDRTCVLSGRYTEDINLTNDTTWVLAGGVFIGNDNVGNATISIEPGTRIVGQSGSDFLVVTRGSRIEADGRPNAPIVFSGPFTASEPDAGAGNFGGLIINGNAPSNDCPNADCEGEGGSGQYGGDDENDSSGVMRYVRVQFGGNQINSEDELNGIAFQGVGAGTVVDYIQVHKNEDDGIEFFGGTVNAKHVVLTGINDDSLDWTSGWRGNIQYGLIVQDQEGDRPIEADNLGDDNDAAPRSQPKLANFTIIGDPGASNPVTFREGTGVNLTNSIITGSATCLDIDNDATFAAAGSPGSLSGVLTIENTTLDCAQDFEDEDGDAFSVETFFTSQAGNQVADPMLEGLFPTAGSSILSDAAMDAGVFGEFFDKVQYRGAFSGEAAAWTHGWTEFLD